MLDWLCYSTKDMVNWTDHGIIASLATFKWAVQDNDAWAPQVVERDRIGGDQQSIALPTVFGLESGAAPNARASRAGRRQRGVDRRVGDPALRDSPTRHAGRQRGAGAPTRSVTSQLVSSSTTARNELGTTPPRPMASRSSAFSRNAAAVAASEKTCSTTTWLGLLAF